ncbi:hypothetical protein MKR66_05185 [Acinetobacter baumannii]
MPKITYSGSQAAFSLMEFRSVRAKQYKLVLRISHVYLKVRHLNHSLKKVNLKFRKSQMMSQKQQGKLVVVVAKVANKTMQQVSNKRPLMKMLWPP